MESIARLIAELPDDYEKDCIEQGAITRRRGVSNPADLMMLAMFHLQNGCSLLEISEVAKMTKLGTMSDVAFMKRFEKCGNWFKAINEKIVSQGMVDYEKTNWLKEKTAVALDASDVVEKGAFWKGISVALRAGYIKDEKVGTYYNRFKDRRKP